jgi:hypothetical protein
MTDGKAHVVVLEVAEIACIIVEELVGKSRPEGVEAHDALRSFSPDEADNLRSAAERIIQYFYAQMQASGATDAALIRHEVPVKLS